MTLLASALATLARSFSLPGLHRTISALYPANWNSKRYVSGVNKRKDGLLMRLDTRNHIDWQLYFTGEFEPQIGVLIRCLLKPGDVAIDVGANIGTHTLEMAAAIGPTGKVYSFEPNALVRSCMFENIRLNGFDRIVDVRSQALGEVRGRAFLRVPVEEDQTYSNQGLSSLVALDTPHREVEVEAEKLDAFIDARLLSQLTMVKIDTQGYDAKVIRGMSRCLTRLSPVIIFEYEAWAWKQADESISDLAKWIGKFGYSLHLLAVDEYKPTFKPIDLSAPPEHADVVALHRNYRGLFS